MRFVDREKILITGANGNLGGALVKELVDNLAYDVVAISREKKLVHDMLEREKISNKDRVYAMDQDTFLHGKWDASSISTAVHAAFSRANKPNKDIAVSLDYSKHVYSVLHEKNIKKVIYVSSQSVYGSISEWRSENAAAAPDSTYAMAKYAGEKLLEEEFDNDPDIMYSILRLDYIIQSQRLVPTLCKNAKKRGLLLLKGGRQTFSYIDRSDAAKAIVALLKYEKQWKHIYNVGPNKMRYSIMEIAQIVREVAQKHGLYDVKINLDEVDTVLWSGMDSSLFMADTGWKPSLDIYQMVEAVYGEV